jgi:hypothetical protein
VLGAMGLQAWCGPSGREPITANMPGMQRRLQRFLSKARVEVKPLWEQELARQRGDITPCEEHARAVSVGLV